MTTSPHIEALRRAIRDVPDFPKPGIVFKDITPLLGDRKLFRHATDALAEPFEGLGITHVAGIESRGFVLAAPVAQRLDAGFVMVRKVGKLPWKTAREEYALEYGTDTLEVHADAVPSDGRVLIVDDVLATGGTAAAACRLLAKVGASVEGFAVLIELGFLGGARALSGPRLHAVLRF